MTYVHPLATMNSKEVTTATLLFEEIKEALKSGYTVLSHDEPYNRKIGYSMRIENDSTHLYIWIYILDFKKTLADSIPIFGTAIAESACGPIGRQKIIAMLAARNLTEAKLSASL